MPENTPGPPHTDPRIYFAADRTLLAWIRTGLAMMGFGFVVARFGLFLREMQAVRPAQPPHPFRGSLWFGVALVLMGALVNFTAALNHTHLVRELREGTWDVNRPTKSGVVIAVLLALTGLAVTFYLLTMP